MDILQGVFAPLPPRAEGTHRPLTPRSPPDYQGELHTIYTYLSPYLTPVLRFLLSLQRTLYPMVLPLLNRAAVFTQDSPAIISVGILVLLLVISVQILNFARRILMFWTRLVMRLTFWGGLAVLGMVVWQRGVATTAMEVVGWTRELADLWLREYRRWEGYQNQGQAARGAANGYGGYTPGRAGGNANARWR